MKKINLCSLVGCKDVKKPDEETLKERREMERISKEYDSGVQQRKAEVEDMLHDLREQLAGCTGWGLDTAPDPADRPMVSKVVRNLIVVDESGSMSVIRKEALAGINETLETCRLSQRQYPEMEQRVTLATFDTGHFKVHCCNALAADTAPLGLGDYCPCGGTPLYDAIGKGIALVQPHTMEGDKVLVTIITDGMENASREYSLAMVKRLIEQLKGQGWTFAFIGTDNLDVEGVGASMSIDNCMAFKETESETAAMFKKERLSRSSFYRRVFEDESVDRFFEE